MSAAHHCDELLADLTRQREGLTGELRYLSAALDELEWRSERQGDGAAVDLRADALRRRIHKLAERLRAIDDRAFALKYSAAQ